MIAFDVLFYVMVKVNYKRITNELKEFDEPNESHTLSKLNFSFQI